MPVPSKELGSGLEPPRLTAQGPTACVSANFTTPALYSGRLYQFGYSPNEASIPFVPAQPQLLGTDVILLLIDEVGVESFLGFG